MLLQSGTLGLRIGVDLTLDWLMTLMSGWIGRGVALSSTIAFWASQANDILRNPHGAWLSTSVLSAVFLGVNFTFQLDKWRRTTGSEKLHALSWLLVYAISIGGAVTNIAIVLLRRVQLTTADKVTFLIVAFWLCLCLSAFGSNMFVHRTGKGWAAAAFRAAPRVVKAAEWPINGSAVGIVTSVNALVLALQRFMPAWYNWRRTRDHADFALMISEGIGNVSTTIPFMVLWCLYNHGLLLK